MDFINDFIQKEYLEAIGWTLIHSIWQIMAISLLFWVVLKFSSKRSSHFRYSAGVIALVLIVGTSIWTFSTALETTTESLSPLETMTSGDFMASAQLEFENQQGVPSAPQKGILDQAWLLSLEAYLPTLVNLWLLGAFFFLVKLTGSLLDLRNLHKKHHENVPDPLIKKVNSMIASIGFYRKVKVLKSQVIHVPITYGILKPVILIPAGLLLQTSPQQLEAIIAHELAHIKRYDYLVNILQHLLEVFFFFHPCFWWINDIIRTERENACDDMVLKLGFTPHDLAYGLAEVAEQAHNATPEMALAATGNQSPTLNRIKRILGMQAKEEKISPIITLTMIVSLMISASLVMGAIPEPEERVEEDYLTAKLKSKTIVKYWNIPCPDEINENNDWIFKRDSNDITNNPIDMAIHKNMDMDMDLEIVNELALQIANDFNKAISIKNEIPVEAAIEKDVKKAHKYAYAYSYLSDTTPKKAIIVNPAPANDPMPVLELSPVPVMDVNIPPVPPVPPMDYTHFVPPHPEVQLDLAEEGREIGQIAMKIAALGQDTTQQGELKRKALESQLKELEKKMAAKTKDYEKKMAEWEKEHGAVMKEWEAKMEAWSKEMEKKQSDWETAFAPKMKEFEKKMEAWEKENEPKIKEFEAKMKAWEKRQREREKEQIEP